MPESKELIGARVRALRKERRLSQEALAGKAGLHTTYLGAIERGEKNVSIETLERIAVGLGVKIYDILVCLAQEIDVARMRAHITKEIRTSSPTTVKIVFDLVKDIKDLESQPVPRKRR